MRSSESGGFEGKFQGMKILGVKSGEIKFREKSGWGNSEGEPCGKEIRRENLEIGISEEELGVRK